jgi:hypothetical protein
VESITQWATAQSPSRIIARCGIATALRFRHDLSPSDRPGEVLEKVGQWLGAGVRLVCVLDQVRRDARVYAFAVPLRDIL